MARKSDRKALGRGLSALLGDADPTLAVSGTAEQIAEGNATTIPIDLIRANPNQPRRTFSDDDLQELAASLKAHGVIQPVLLRPDPDDSGRYQIVAGERRWRAAQLAGIHSLPAVIRNLDDQTTLEFAIIENVQRVDLDPVEEAQGYVQLTEMFGYTQEQLSEVIGKSRSHLANSMRLLNLPERVLEFLRAGKLSAGHARALVTAKAPIPLAERVITDGLSVRQTEKLAKEATSGSRSSSTNRSQKDADTRQLEGDLAAAIGMRVAIDHREDGKGGTLKIRYGSLDDLDALCRKLSA